MEILYNGVFYEQNNEDYGLVAIFADTDYSEPDVFIPEQINGIRVIAIDDNAFEYNTNIKSVSIPANLSRIGCRAFAGCVNLDAVEFRDMENINATEDLMIMHEAFAECSKLRIIKGNSRNVSLGSHVFRNCSVLSQLDFAIKSLWWHTFEDCHELKILTFYGNPDLVIPRKIVELSQNEVFRDFILKRNIKIKCKADSLLVNWSSYGINVEIVE